MRKADIEAMTWFNSTFGEDVKEAVTRTPFSKALVLAIAMQETSYLWRGLYRTNPVEKVLALCVGDTIDKPGRGAFPKNRADLQTHPRGKDMFKLARACLKDIAQIDRGYANVFKNRDKFCHGFGMFQYDLQFFEIEPDYFLDRKWATFPGTLGKCIAELKDKLKRVYGPKKKKLDHNESVYVAIAYNKGSADLNKDFRQGHKNKAGKFYGELLDEYLTAAEAMP